MIARIRKSLDEKEKGFTLIELLVVMIIIGILAAIAIPVFLNQRAKAQDSAAKADVSTFGKEIATYWVDGAVTAPAITGGNGVNYTLAGQDLGRSSTNVVLTSTAAKIVSATTWCVGVKNAEGSASGGQIGYRYSASAGLEKGLCG